MALNILLVDDSRTVRNVIAKALRLSKVPIRELHEAGNGREALDVLEAHRIDLVFADLHMPVMTGFEMLKKMSRDGVLGTIPVVVVSSEGNLQRVEELMDHGVRAFVHKPFTPEAIREVVVGAIPGVLTHG